MRDNYRVLQQVECGVMLHPHAMNLGWMQYKEGNAFHHRHPICLLVSTERPNIYSLWILNENGMRGASKFQRYIAPYKHKALK